jgi:hypothetical protein
LDEQQTCVAREFADGLGLGKFRFYCADSAHYSAPTIVASVLQNCW